MGKSQVTWRRKRAVQLARVHPVAWLIRHIARNGQSVQAPASLWLDVLNAGGSDEAKQSRQWPRSPEALGRTFSSLREGLGALGVVLTPHKCRVFDVPARVWRIETKRANRLQRTYGRVFEGADLTRRPGNSPKISPFWLMLLQTEPMKAENGPKHSAFSGYKKKMGRLKQLFPVENCARIHPQEGAHVGVQTQKTPVANSRASRLWLVCPQCQNRKRFLYRRPDEAAWKCFECNRLTTKERQSKGTNAAFDEWLTLERFGRMLANHPENKRVLNAMANDWRTNVAPFDWANVDEARRAELRAKHGGNAQSTARREFEARRHECANRWEIERAKVAQEIRADIKQWWRHRKRSNSKTKRERDAEPAPTN